MGILGKLKQNFENQAKFLFKTDKAPDLKQYVGKSVIIDDKRIEIQSIVTNKWKPAFYEINGKHLIGMLRFHAQMTGAKDITEEEFKAFEDMEFEVETPQKKSIIEVPNVKS